MLCLQHCELLENGIGRHLNNTHKYFLYLPSFLGSNQNIIEILDTLCVTTFRRGRLIINHHTKSVCTDLKSRICEVQKCDGVENCPLDPGEAVAWDERNCIPYENITFQPPLPKTTTTPSGEFPCREGFRLTGRNVILSPYLALQVGVIRLIRQVQ